MLKMNDGKYFMFQGSVYDVLMWFGWDFNCNRIYFNFLIKIFLFVKMEKCYVVIEKKLVSFVYFRLGILYRILFIRFFVVVRFRLQFLSIFLKILKQFYVLKYLWFMNV